MGIKEAIMKETKKKSTKAQTWSMDIIIGVVLFLILLVIVYVLIKPTEGSDLQLRRDADRIYTKLDETRTSDTTLPKVLTETVLDEEELKDLLEKEYTMLKGTLGITGDFCIVLVDEYGGILNISTDKRSYGIRDHNVIIGTNGTETIYCGE